jgi:hypothetical protein
MAYTAYIQSLDVELEDPTSTVDESTDFTTTLGIQAHILHADCNLSVGTLGLNLGLPEDYVEQELTQSGGCPFCGTLLYYKRAESVKYKRGGNDTNDDRRVPAESGFLRCGRCGFVCNTDRDRFSREGSKEGWGTITTTNPKSVSVKLLN